MIDKNEVQQYFDRLAPDWDAGLEDRSNVIASILDNAKICEGLDVLDVACGTGVLFPYYMRRKVRSVTGIDISSEMARIAAAKFAGESRITVICGDVETAVFDRQFDSVMVYNAFPHFPDAKRLIAALAALTKSGGRLSVAHSMSVERINDHHKGSASPVSNGLMSAVALRELFEEDFTVDVEISNSEMYQVCGIRK